MEIFLIRSYRRFKRRFDPSKVELVATCRRQFVLPINGLNYTGLLVHMIEPAWAGPGASSGYTVSWKDYLTGGTQARFGYRIRLSLGSGTESIYHDCGLSVMAEIALLNYFTGSLLEVVPITSAATEEYFASSIGSPMLATLQEFGDVEIVGSFHKLTFTQGSQRIRTSFSRLDYFADRHSYISLVERYLTSLNSPKVDNCSSEKSLPATETLQNVLTHLAELVVFCTHAYQIAELRPSIKPAIEHAIRILETIDADCQRPLTESTSKSHLRSALGKSLKQLKSLLDSVSQFGTPKQGAAVEAIARGAFKLTTALKSTEATAEEELLLKASLSKPEVASLLALPDLKPVEALALALYQTDLRLKSVKIEMPVEIGKPAIPENHTSNFRFALKDKTLIFSRLTESQEYLLRLPEDVNWYQVQRINKPGADVVVVKSHQRCPPQMVVDLSQKAALMKKEARFVSQGKDLQMIPSPWAADVYRLLYSTWDKQLLYLAGHYKGDNHFFVHRFCSDAYLAKQQMWTSCAIFCGQDVDLDYNLWSSHMFIQPHLNGRSIYLAYYLERRKSYSFVCLEYETDSNQMKIKASFEEELAPKWYSSSKASKQVLWWNSHRRMFAVMIENVTTLMVRYHDKTKFVPVLRICGLQADINGRVKLDASAITIFQQPITKRIMLLCIKTNNDREQTGYPELETWLLRPSF